MIGNEDKLKALLEVLEDEGILPNIILIGSWSLLFYKQIFEDFRPLIRTTDIDFYVPNSKAIKDNKNVIYSLKDINYDILNDTISHKSAFVSPDGFELEFLTKLNRKGLACVKLGNTEIYAESISYVDIFTGNYIEVVYDHLTLKVASPASYVLQKLLINRSRKEKKEKDIDSVKHVLQYIKHSRKSVDEIRKLFSSIPKRWQKTILEVASENAIDLFE